MNLGNQQPPAVQIDIDNLPLALCKDCGGSVFKDVFILRELSSLQSGTGKSEYIPQPVFLCVKCGQIAGNKSANALQSETRILIFSDANKFCEWAVKNNYQMPGLNGRDKVGFIIKKGTDIKIGSWKLTEQGYEVIYQIL